MTTRQLRSRRAQIVTLGASVVLTVVGVAAVLGGEPTVRALVLAVAAAALSAYVATTHPLTIFGAFAVVLGFAPFVHLPGTDIPMLLVLAVGLWVALASIPGIDFRPGWCEAWVAGLAALALVSVVATHLSSSSLIEYVAWVAATATVIPIRFLPSAAQRTTVRVFVFSAAAASVVGTLLLLNPSGIVARALSFTGVDPARPNVQTVAGSELLSIRLNGTYLEANIAGFILAAALLLALVFVSGRMRVVLIVVIGAGLLLTLSRGAMATVAVALALLVLRTAGRHRARLILVGVAGAVASALIPAVRSRLLDSFGPTDTGSVARLKALQDFSDVMSGHWVWGLGWARPEFRDADLNRAANLVANTPLATIYRGGVLLGLLVVAVMIALVVRSWLMVRHSYADAVLGCSIIAFVLVSLQLDYPVVTQPSVTVTISMLVGLSMRHDRPPEARRELAPAGSAPQG